MTDLDGNKTAKQYREKIKTKVRNLESEGIHPTIAPILVGDNPGAKVYFRTKKKLANKLGIKFAGVKLDKDITREELLTEIDQLNRNSSVHGLFIELPLPQKFYIGKLNKEINPKKDIDCIHPVNSGKLISGGAMSASYGELKQEKTSLLPATPFGVMELLTQNEIDLKGKEVVVVGAGAVGLPLAMLMLREGYSTVSLCEYQTEGLKNHTKRADIICVAVGKKNFLTKDMVKQGAVIVDIGINQTENGITGDVDYENVKEKASYITPVPGGVGPMTTTMIMWNTVKAAQVLNN